MKKFWVLLTLATVNHFAWADLASDCDYLSERACRKGKNDTDPTGSVKSGLLMPFIESEHVDTLLASARTQFARLLGDVSRTEFRSLADEAAPSSNFIPCNEPRSESKCTTARAGELARIALKILLPRRLVPGIADIELGRLRIIENADFTETLDRLGKETKNLFVPVETEKSVEKIFAGVRRTMIESISKWPIEDGPKAALVARLESVRYAGSDCGVPNQSRDAGIDSLLRVNAFYSVQSKTFSYCGGLMAQSSSTFTLAFIIGHELAHSIDPCTVALGAPPLVKYTNPLNDAGSETENPFGRVLTCLRGPASVKARRSTLDRLAVMARRKLGPIIDVFRPENVLWFGNVPLFCRHWDQLQEAFADWLGAESSAAYIDKTTSFTSEEYRRGYANVFRITCESDSDEDEDPAAHPQTEKRIDAILSVNPIVRRHMGCPEPSRRFVYCDMNGGQDKSRATKNAHSESSQ